MTFEQKVADLLALQERIDNPPQCIVCGDDIPQLVDGRMTRSDKFFCRDRCKQRDKRARNKAREEETHG